MLEGFLKPRSVAVVGAAREPGKVGRYVFDNLVDGGFDGEVFPVNPSADEIGGRRAYPSVSSLPETPDLAVLVVPAKAAASVLAECGRKGIRSVIVISAGFKETGTAGAELERQLMDVAAEHDIRVLGPNCLGLVAPHWKLNASFAASMPPKGDIAFMSQSGALGTFILDWAQGEGVGLSYFISLGNKADLSEVDLLQAFAEDEHSGVLVAYLESVSDGAAFVRQAAEASAKKPVIVLKSGRTDAGARAVSSHTGSLSGSEAAYEAAFRKGGVIRASSVEELFDLSVGFSRQPMPRGSGLAILTNAGGPGILTTDACESLGVPLAQLDKRTVDALREAMPAAGSPYNPVDVLGDAGADRYAECARILYEDPNVHSLLVLLTPQATTEAVETAQAIVDRAAESDKTTLAAFMGTEAVADALPVLRAGSVPNYPFPERAVSTLAAMQRRLESLARPPSNPVAIQGDPEVVRRRVAEVRSLRQSFITEEAAADIARAYGIPVPGSGMASSLSSAKRLAASLGYPLVMKVSSPDILHKSDVGGIKVGINDEQELAEAYETIMRRVTRRMPDADVWGVTLQEMVQPGREVIIGMNRDPQFGPLILFGLGGIYVEVLKDVTHRLAPVSAEDAREMVGEIRTASLLRGARGMEPADIDAIVDVIVRVSALAMDVEDLLELDINPLIVHDKGGGAVAADVRIGIGG